MDHLVSTKTETQTSGGSPEDCSTDERGDCLCQITVRLEKKFPFLCILMHRNAGLAIMFGTPSLVLPFHLSR